MVHAPDQRDVVRWHVEHCWHVRAILQGNATYIADMVLAMDAGASLVMRLRLERPGLFAAIGPAGVG